MLSEVLGRIGEACRRSGRDPREVRLIAVTKGHSASEIEEQLLRRGHLALGENRIQEWRDKAQELAAHAVEWHFIGNLQRNKVKYCRPFHTIHSLGSSRLADELQRQAERLEHRFRVLVEVNVAGEESKAGVSLAGAQELVEYARSLPGLEVAGLMTMAPWSERPEDARPHFAKLRELRDKLGLVELSMGMSNDFEVAVEEGATMVRVGSAIFSGNVG